MNETFGSFFLGGFECSTQRRDDGRRLDLTRSTRHDLWCGRDYAELVRRGITGARDGLRWHRIEATPGVYDWSSFLPMLHAARDNRMRVAWDLCHYGWPDHIEIWSPDFISRFAAFAAAAARLVRSETDGPPVFCPVNEISFWAWAGGDMGRMNPCEKGRGAELKRQLVRAAIAAVQAVRGEVPEARFLYAEPLIHVDGGLGSPAHRREAEAFRISQFQAFDMISGRLNPELGGRPEYLDIVGVNYYPDNQWYLGGSTIPMGHHAYRPFSQMLREVHARYGRPILIAETGAEGSGRAAWLHYVTDEVLVAMDGGVPVMGICLYPILDGPGWSNGRLCPVGLFSEIDRHGERTVFGPLEEELTSAQARIARRFRNSPQLSLFPEPILERTA